jgi:hypothetical protein
MLVVVHQVEPSQQDTDSQIGNDDDPRAFPGEQEEVIRVR